MCGAAMTKSNNNSPTIWEVTYSWQRRNRSSQKPRVPRCHSSGRGYFEHLACLHFPGSEGIQFSQYMGGYAQHSQKLLLEISGRLRFRKFQQRKNTIRLGYRYVCASSPSKRAVLMSEELKRLAQHRELRRWRASDSSGYTKFQARASSNTSKLRGWHAVSKPQDQGVSWIVVSKSAACAVWLYNVNASRTGG